MNTGQVRYSDLQYTFYSLELQLIKTSVLFNSPSTISLFMWETRSGKDRFQIKVLTLVQNIMENRLRHAIGPVHYIESVTFIRSYGQKYLVIWFLFIQSSDFGLMGMSCCTDIQQRSTPPNMSRAGSKLRN